MYLFGFRLEVHLADGGDQLAQEPSQPELRGEGVQAVASDVIRAKARLQDAHDRPLASTGHPLEAQHLLERVVGRQAVAKPLLE